MPVHKLWQTRILNRAQVLAPDTLPLDINSGEDYITAPDTGIFSTS